MGRVVERRACTHCGSRDNVAVYEDGGHYCFTPGCTNSAPGSDYQGETPVTVNRLTMPGVVDAIKDRAIPKGTCEKYKVTVEYGERGEIVTHSYPYFRTDTKELTAAKRRYVADKGFSWSGNRENIGLFGEQTCRGRGKFITITEGELDMLSVSAMFDDKWDVVSVRDGAGNAARDIKDRLEFLEGYDNIVLCFDNDEAGQKAIDECKDLFSPNKLKLVKLPSNYKDPNAMLMASRRGDFERAWWDAKPYSPAGIVKPSETWDAVLTYRHTPSTPYPWSGLNDMLMGQRTGELVIWAAETGVGKSQTMREIIHHSITENPDERVGCLMLEESVAKSMMGWMSFYAGRPLHKDPTTSDDELRKYWEMASKDDRFVLLDHKGWGNNIEKLKARCRFMAKSLGCRKIILDHLHIALSSVEGASGDWAGIDELVTQLTVLAQECDICLHLVSHVSEGRSLRGSKGISKLCDALIFLERDKHHEDPEIANTTQVVVDKNRWAGDVGTACYLRYDRGTGRMTECPKPEALEVPDEF